MIKQNDFWLKCSLNFSTSMIEQLQTDARAWYQLKSVRSMLDNKKEQKCKEWMFL